MARLEPLSNDDAVAKEYLVGFFFASRTLHL